MGDCEDEANKRKEKNGSIGQKVEDDFLKTSRRERKIV